jgi:hypothetical protein
MKNQTKTANDREAVLAELSNDGDALEYVSDELKADREIVLAAVQNSGRSLEYADDSLKSDREVVLAAVQNSGFAIEYASDELKADRGIVLLALENDGHSFSYISDELKADREIVLAAVQSSSNKYKQSILLSKMDDIFQSDQEIVLAAIEQNFEACRFASDTLKSNPDFVDEAIKLNKRVRKYLIKEPLGEMHGFEVTWEVYYWDEEVGYTTTESFKSKSVDDLLEELSEGLDDGSYCPEMNVTFHEGDFNVDYVLIHDSEGKEVYRGEGEMDSKDW